jgi:hypothetical protein
MPPPPEFLFSRVNRPVIARELPSFDLLSFEHANGFETLQLSLKTIPPLVVVGSKVYRLNKVWVHSGPGSSISLITPDDTRLYEAVRGFNCLYCHANVLFFAFDPESRLSLLGRENISRLIFFHDTTPLTADEIARVAVHNAHAVENTCSICLEVDIGPWARLPCGHVFHPNCIDRWISINRSCPCCRRGVV